MIHWNKQWMRVTVLLVGLGIILLTGCTAASTTPVTSTTPVVSTTQAAVPTVPQSSETYKIGFLAAVTGSASSLGVPERDAARMIQEQLNAQGGIVGPGGVRRKVEIIIYDTQGSGDVAIPLAKKLISDDKVVAIVGGSVSGESLAMVPIMQEAKIPYISIASSSQICEPASERYWVFKTAQNNAHTAPKQIEYVKAKGLTKVANLYVNNAYGLDGRNAISDLAKKAGVDIILEETFEATDTNMTAQLTKVKASGAQAVLVTAIPPAASLLTKNFRELGLNVPLVQNHGIGTKDFITLAGVENAEGVLFPMGKLVAVDSLSDDDPQKPVLEKFIKDYEAFTKNPSSTFAGHAWDGLQLVLKALETLPSGLPLEEQRAQIRNSIETTRNFAGIGGVFNLSPEDHVGLSSRDVVLVRVTNGSWEYFPPDRW
jgi:branched-chain amino acid transport system substrate-binding protein